MLSVGKPKDRLRGQRYVRAQPLIGHEVAPFVSALLAAASLLPRPRLALCWLLLDFL